MTRFSSRNRGRNGTGKGFRVCQGGDEESRFADLYKMNDINNLSGGSGTRYEYGGEGSE